jgi:hypothetical protein
VTKLATPIDANSENWTRYMDWYQSVIVPLAWGTVSGSCGIEGEPPEDPSSCEIFADGVQLLHFPHTAPVSRDMCATMPPLVVHDLDKAEHVPMTVFEGTTLFRDRAYLSIKKISAFTSTWTSYVTQAFNGVNSTIWECSRDALGTVVSNTLIEVRSEEVFSLRYPNVGTSYPFSYAVRSFEQCSCTNMQI